MSVAALRTASGSLKAMLGVDADPLPRFIAIRKDFRLPVMLVKVVVEGLEMVGSDGLAALDITMRQDNHERRTTTVEGGDEGGDLLGAGVVSGAERFNRRGIAQG